MSALGAPPEMGSSRWFVQVKFKQAERFGIM
jgi:hypothetical protein